MSTFIFCGVDEHGDPLNWPTDTPDEIAAAQAAPRREDEASAEVWVGAPGSAESYKNGTILHAR
jgi:hypothetical protein